MKTLYKPMCNRAKHVYTVEQFREWLKRAYARTVA